ncbi:DUF2513 domain-containing protein [Kordiimonas sp.]|uniref:DUF2513 domain-containing protein n=1 Tax=Kordiimonas sp. TaxID=1970157 RepID=UPI003A8D4E18
MKRDMDLIREIMFAVEESDHDPLSWMTLSIDGRSQLEVSYHVQLLDEAGLITAVDLSSSDGLHWEPKQLTWDGHEFLDNARSATTWKRVKQIVAERTGSASLDVIQNILTEQATALLT